MNDLDHAVDEPGTVDLVHAAGGVYCRECAMWLPSDVPGEYECALSVFSTLPDDFCSIGRRKPGGK